MRVLIVGMTSNPGGIESYVMSVFRSFRYDENIEFYFLNSSESELAYSDEILEHSGRIIQIKKPKMERHFSELLWKIKVLKSNKFDVIHVNALTAGNIDWLILANKYQKNAKLIIHSHNSNSPLINHSFFGKIRGVVWNRNTKWLKKHPEIIKLAASSESAKWMFKTNDNVHVIPNSIDVKKFLWSKEKYLYYRKMLQFKTNETIILVPSRIADQKNYPKILSIFKAIVEKKADSRLVIAGGGSADKVRWLFDKIHELNLNDHVEYLGVRNDINKIMIASDIMLMPSLYEGLSVAALEGQAAGLKTYLSKDVIPNEVKISKAIKFISLSESSEKWADIIIDDLSNSLNRVDCNDEVANSDYSLENLLREMKLVYYGRENKIRNV